MFQDRYHKLTSSSLKVNNSRILTNTNFIISQFLIHETLEKIFKLYKFFNFHSCRDNYSWLLLMHDLSTIQLHVPIRSFSNSFIFNPFYIYISDCARVNSTSRILTNDLTKQNLIIPDLLAVYTRYRPNRFQILCTTLEVIGLILTDWTSSTGPNRRDVIAVYNHWTLLAA